MLYTQRSEMLYINVKKLRSEMYMNVINTTHWSVQLSTEIYSLPALGVLACY